MVKFLRQLGPARIFVSKAMMEKGWSYSQAGKRVLECCDGSKR
jgi:hypothetical protein